MGLKSVRGRGKKWELGASGNWVRWTIGSLDPKSKNPENQKSQIVKLPTNALVIRMIKQLDSLFSS
jgi:hypothetical protein